MEIIFFITVLLVNAVIDGLLWRRGNYIDGKGHQFRFFLRFIFFSLIGVIVYDPTVGPHASAALLPIYMIQASVWWILFDPLVNVIAGQKLFHLGRTSGFDRIFWILGDYKYKRALALQYSTKLVALALSLVVVSPAGFDVYMGIARDIYFNSIW